MTIKVFYLKTKYHKRKGSNININFSATQGNLNEEVYNKITETSEGTKKLVLCFTPTSTLVRIATCLGIWVLQEPDAVIASERGGGGNMGTV